MKGNSMIKVDTRVKESTFDKIKAIAESEHEGNFSLTLRKLIESGLLNHQFVLDVKEVIKDEQTKA